MSIDDHRTALWGTTEGIRITHRMVKDAVATFTALLEARGIREGEVVAISCAGRLNQAIYLSCGLHHRITITPLNPEYHPLELRRVLAHCDAQLIISDQPERLSGLGCKVQVADLDRLLAPRSSISDPPSLKGHLLIYTSGTTGAPKAVLLNPDNIIANVNTVVSQFGYDSQWTTASILPLFHTFTIISDLIPMVRQGGTCIVCPTFTAQDGASIQQAMIDHGVQSYSAVPVIFQAISTLFQPTARPGKLKFAIAGAAPLSERVRLEYNERRGHPVIPCYGLTESTCFATISPLNRIKPHSVGKPAGIDILVINPDDGRPVKAGRVGELAICGSSVMSGGYFKDSLERASHTPDGYLLTGDMGYWDADNYLYVTGRKKNMVIRGGEKIYLEDLDEVIGELPSVRDCVSVAQVVRDFPDQVWTFIVLNEGPALALTNLMSHVRGHLSTQHCPDHVRFLDEIPRTKTGKPVTNSLLALITPP